MAKRREQETTSYPCMAMPARLHRVHTLEDDHLAQLTRRSRRRSLRRLLGRGRLESLEK